ncbi:hypothetical protein [Candidatus Phytoplasma australiense]|uniref:Uncharacterized protein n=1 Tax=Strawberry lethal yellows phytoplasma (CPA) str. NZSb11 TaxID=980422 RepID=R4RPX5_PHYAS|nr:hypothetical protein [Candidatus Phytoplasma australiense]AGL90531.1 hypothetical protein SLY_0615 [Strawberry lethal yellows phytoplasma (CPA) str. NZSb11]AGL90621.1 Hypothetical Protein possibly ftsH- associated [Strawberry lethal yellows phytoplasma (CPA) str. NZSb11]AGL90886.1 Hypothetical Protein possibly ftsH-associated [Strawberry lethal yellows phytoplasma (CPA) str. NZSb11]
MKKPNQKPNNKTKNKIIIVLSILMCSFFAISSVMAINNYFSRQKQEKIKLMSENNAPLFEVNKISGNNEDKTLIPLPMPNLNPNKYHHTITINHQAVLNLNGFDSDIGLYLKITPKYDTHNTFSNPETLFNLEIKTNNIIYDDTKRQQLIYKPNGKGNTNIQIKLEQNNFVKATNPLLTLVLDYELVDSNGNAFSGSGTTIENKIKNLA